MTGSRFFYAHKWIECLPCPHLDIAIIKRSNSQSAVASAAYQSGDRLFSEYAQEQKYYSHKSEIVHKEILLLHHRGRKGEHRGCAHIG